MEGRNVNRHAHTLTGNWNGPPGYNDEPDIASRTKRYHKAMALKDEIGLTDEERYSLALLIPGVDKDGDGSWKDLNAKQLHDLITMMEGWVFIEAMRLQRLDNFDPGD